MLLSGDLDTVLIKVKLDSIIDNISSGGQRRKTVVGYCLLSSTKLCSGIVILDNQGYQEGAGWQAVIANSWSSDLDLSARIPMLIRYHLSQVLFERR